MTRQKEIAAEVKRVLDSPYFNASPSLARTLAFCVDTTLNNDQASLKETIIGLSCFGRDPGYDTKLDPIVRVTIRRLRKKLDSYYLDEGRDAKIRIDFPKGSYIPRFECIEEQILPEVKSTVLPPAEAFSVTEQADLVAVPEIVMDKGILNTSEIASSYRSLWQNIRVWQVPVSLTLLVVAAVSIGFVWNGQGSRSFSWTKGSPLHSSRATSSLEAMSSLKLQSEELLADAEPALKGGRPAHTGGHDVSRTGTRASTAQNSSPAIHPVANGIELATLTDQTNDGSSKGARAVQTSDADRDAARPSPTWTEPRL